MIPWYLGYAYLNVLKDGLSPDEDEESKCLSGNACESEADIVEDGECCKSICTEK